MNKTYHISPIVWAKPETQSIHECAAQIINRGWLLYHFAQTIQSEDRNSAKKVLNRMKYLAKKLDKLSEKVKVLDANLLYSLGLNAHKFDIASGIPFVIGEPYTIISTNN